LHALASIVGELPASAATDVTIREQIVSEFSNKAWSPRDFKCGGPRRWSFGATSLDDKFIVKAIAALASRQARRLIQPSRDDNSSNWLKPK
jgi:hypothetical protein